MSSVTVLCPNARRQQVKIEPNLKILQIIEEVCKKQGLNSDEYDLIFQKRKLDVTLTFRLSGVPINAQLELKKLDIPRKTSDVVLVIQLEDGSRLPQLTFKPDLYLYDVINAFKNASDSLLLKLEESITNINQYQPIVSYLNEEVIGEFQLKNTQLKDLGLTGGRSLIRFNYRIIDEETFLKSNQEFEKKLEKKLELEKKSKEFQQKTQIITEASIVKEEQICNKNPVQESKIDEVIFKKQKNEQSMDVDETNNAAFSDRVMINNEFMNFKFPESTKGMKLNDINELAEIEELSKQACPREELIYKIDDITSNDETISSNPEEIPDDFYDLTVNDLRYMIDDLQRKINSDQPLMTKAMRELDNDRKAMKYEKVVIRIRFSNKFILQGLFRPKEQVQSLYNFVESCIDMNNESNKDFYLYTTPPKVVLNDKKKTLFEANLCPASILHFGNITLTAPNFKENIKLKTIDEANEIATKNVHQRMRNIKDEGIEWLIKENELTNNILKSTGFTKSTTTSNSQSSTATTSRNTANNNNSSSTIDELTRKKFEKFLGSKK